jgi:PAS domain S-box-containing protein
VSDAVLLKTDHLEFATAVDRLNCGVIGRDVDGILIFANDRILSWLDYTWNELVGKSLSHLVPEELDAVVHEELRGIESGDIRARITIFKRKDSTTFPVLLIPNQYPGPDGPFFAVAVELSTVQTAKPVGYGGDNSLRSSLDRIALELKTISMMVDMTSSLAIPIGYPQLQALSEREREVLAHLVSGERVPSIAKQLHISPHTVRNHLKSIYRQVGVGNQSELIEHVRSFGAASGDAT